MNLSCEKTEIHFLVDWGEESSVSWGLIWFGFVLPEKEDSGC